MKLHCLPASLAAALDVASKAVARRGIHPSLDGVLLEATPDGGLRITGTDTERRAWHTVSARVDVAGSVILPPKSLQEFVANVPQSDAVVIEVDSKHKAVLTCGRTVVRVAGLDWETFPAAPSFDDPSFDFTLAADVFARVVANVAHAIAPDESRPVLSGIFLRAQDGVLQLVTADGFRLAMSSEALDGIPDLSVIAHGRALTEAAKTASGATSVRVQVDRQQSQILVDSENGSWAARLIDGQYPDVNRITPKDDAITSVVTVSRADAVRVAKLIRSLTTESTDSNGKGKTRTVMARLTVADGEMTVAARDTTADHEATAVIDAEVTSGDGIAITFNGRYLLDALESLPTDRVTFQFTSPKSPTIVRPNDPDSRQMCILMPMHDARAT